MNIRNERKLVTVEVKPSEMEIIDDTTIENLENEYIDTNVGFDGNDDVEAFYGRVSSFDVDSDGSIYVTLIDMDDEAFDIDWEEVKNGEFD